MYPRRPKNAPETRTAIVTLKILIHDLVGKRKSDERRSGVVIIIDRIGIMKEKKKVTWRIMIQMMKDDIIGNEIARKRLGNMVNILPVMILKKMVVSFQNEEYKEGGPLNFYDICSFYFSEYLPCFTNVCMYVCMYVRVHEMKISSSVDKISPLLPTFDWLLR
jgi:hypothetical protein